MPLEEDLEVIVADDHKLVREGICKLLELFDEIEVIDEVGDGLETVASVRDKFPDLVLLDINMPRMNGIEAAKKIKEISPEIKVLILTIHEDREYIYEVTRVGAEGYLQKDVKPEVLYESMVEVMAGNKVFPAAIEDNIDEEDIEEKEITELSEREHQVLELLAQGMSNKELAEELYISEKTVKNHVSNILNKLSVNDRTQAVILGLKKGLVSL